MFLRLRGLHLRRLATGYAAGAGPFSIRRFTSRATNAQASSKFSLLGSSGICVGLVGFGLAGSQTKAEAKQTPSFTMGEVAKHHRPDDAWIVLDGMVYDVTKWLNTHPGGKGVLLKHAGKDASREFACLGHSPKAYALRENFLIGEVEDYEPPPAREEWPAQSPKKKQVVIVGAGICGVSAAYHLSEKLPRESYEITVVDKLWIVGGTALKSSAIMFMGPLLEARKEMKQSVGLAAWLGQLSYEMAAGMQRDWENIAFTPRPMMGLISSEEELAMARKTVAGNDRLLTRDEALALEPALAGNPTLVGAVLKPDCCTMDPFLVCNAYYERAKAAGVRFVFGREVEKLERRAGGRFSVMCRGEPEYEADMLLLCAGHLDNWMAGLLGHNVPVKSMHGQMFAARLPDDVEPPRHMIFSYEGPLYWRKNFDGGNSTLDGKTLERRCHHIYGLQIAGSDRMVKFGGDRVAGDRHGEVIKEGLRETRMRVEELLPKMAAMEEIGDGWGGTMPFTPDQNIIVGDLEPGLFVCTGAPFTKGAAAGLLLAEAVAPSPPDHPDYLSKCSPKRFHKSETKATAGTEKAQGG